MPFVKELYILEKEEPAFLFLMRELNLSQGESQRLIDRGRLFCNGLEMKDKSALVAGNIEVVLFRPDSRLCPPLFSCRDFMVFDKPSGVLVHPKTMNTPHSMLDEVRYYGGFDANAVHRLDMETSGLLLASRHKKAEKFLKSSFENRSIQKKYRAWARGKIDKAFTVSRAISLNRDYSKTKHKVFIDDKGKDAATSFVPLQYDEEINSTLLECIPHTGRTHQIRIHLFHVKHSILGDPIYGPDFYIAEKYLEKKLTPEERMKHTGASRLMLHAYSLEFKCGNTFFIESRDSFYKEKKKIASYKCRDDLIHSGVKNTL